MSKTLFYLRVTLAACFLSTPFIVTDPLLGTTRVVNSTSDNPAMIGTLPFWLLNADNGDTIDCSEIAGQQITLTSSLPAITQNYTINGAGITINGDNSYQAFQVASGIVTINNINVQNAISKGGNGGSGYSGGGGAAGGGGAMYVHGSASVTLTASSLINNTARGGDGGSASNIGNAGAGGGGGFGGGNGGDCLTDVSTGGGGGGHSNGGDGGSSSSVNGSNGVYFGGAGGGAGINSVVPGGAGGNAGPTGAFAGGAEFSGNGGGGAGNSQDGFSATGTGSSGIPGNGGNGIGADLLFGAGGGGGGASETGFPGGAGVGAAGGGGGSNYSGGAGGILGGGGGGGLGAPGGAGGFGAGGGGAATGGAGGASFGAGGGNGASDPSGNGAGGGGSGLGGAIFIQKGGHLSIVDALQISGNTAIAGDGGSSTSTDINYVAPGNGAAMGYDIFLRQGGSLICNVRNTLTILSPIEGDSLTTPLDNSGFLIKKGTGILELNGTNTYVGQTTIKRGTLKLNGSIRNDLLIDPNGQLSGNATVGGTIYNNGTISPGNSIGTVFATNLSLSSSSICKIEIEPTKSDLIYLSGTANLAGKVKIIQDPGRYNTQGQYIILTAAGGLSGSIDSLEIQGLPGFQFSLRQDNFNLFLMYERLLPPSHVRGKRVHERDFVNILEWDQPKKGASPISYKVYRHDLKTLVGVVPANGKLKFRDHARSKKSVTYYIVSIGLENSESAPASITIDHR